MLDGERIRFGLEAIKGVGGGAAETLVGLREQRDGGRYCNLDEVLIDGVAANINRSTFENLAKAGALDQLAERNQVLLQMEHI
ncbi:MAG: hypothetical protein IID05_12955 [Gemmatimonadetes bacterium]|nr:hypothetical protein [Gemmatimonadota bacterium]